jgi:curli biogenesis system outer membrane secretion channel CsgG
MIISSCTTTRTVKKTKSSSISVEKYLGPKQKIAVARFENATRFGQRRLGENITAVLSTELNKTNRFILLEREHVDKILEQVAFSQSGLTEGNLDQVALLDADFILAGAVTHYAVQTTGSKNIFTQSKTQTAQVKADVRIINVRTGEILLSETGSGIAEKEFSKVMGMGKTGGYDESLEMDAFRAAVVDVTENIIRVIDNRPWICDVVEIAEEGLYIDAGQQSNLMIGDSLDIYFRGEAVRNLSGIIIGYKEKMCAIGVVTKYFGENGALITPDSDQDLHLPLICKIHN